MDKNVLSLVTMVLNLNKLIKADLYAAITGLASVGGSETKDKPVGTIFFSLLYKGYQYNEHRLFKGSPLEIKKKACKTLYKLILEIIAV